MSIFFCGVAVPWPTTVSRGGADSSKSRIEHHHMEHNRRSGRRDLSTKGYRVGVRQVHGRRKK